MVYYLNTLLLLNLFKYITVAAFRIYLSVVKMPLKGEVDGHVDHGKSWKNHRIVFLSFCGNPDIGKRVDCDYSQKASEYDQERQQSQTADLFEEYLMNHM